MDFYRHDGKFPGSINGLNLQIGITSIPLAIGLILMLYKSKIISAEILNHADLAVTLCGDAADRCPMTHQSVKRVHWGFDEPAKAGGTEEDKWKTFHVSVTKLVIG